MRCVRRMGSLFSAGVVSFASAAGCAKGASEETFAAIPVSEAGTLDATLASDADAETGAPPVDAGDAGTTGDAACTLGTGDHCGACATSCGTTDKQSLYGCTDATSAGACTLTCRAEFYDLDGNIANGCEAEDPIVQDTVASAVAKALDDTVTSLNLVGYVYGDARPHEKPPFARPMGREDWYQVTVTGNGQNFGFGACLGIPNFPADDTFEVCTTDAGGSTFSYCGQPKGGGVSACVKPSGGANAGVYLVRVRKVSGSNTPNGYALFMQH